MSEATFPHGKWGRDDVSALFKPVFSFAASPLGSKVIRAIVPLDRRVVDRTKGRFSLFGPLSMPELLLTTTGRKSGQPRTSVLSYVHEGDRLLVMGSNFGQQQHPSWSTNLVAEPQASISMAGQDIPVTATLLTDGERDAALQRFLAYPMYRAYQTRTDRDLRVFALTRR
ncbi:nitroreductase family deazaflavin-dependent oxidoreductase [Mycolicibacterium neworleansense]|uniref:Deazaflavin-dependent nitroreductase family protein n=1 Tax=Mycolicibacterium neworleansense TaxID=146018 RepID=A0A0H5RIB9_9MYCO|nr:nitroreductase family deazaflavin-dependent oxidoreductase [Mycolicibacterium neworleansense]MCV7362096.1 nitroreductase family deazaflavin-dependent oxidoreductase [Mycolicibacterium neworleansense]CRZ13496.1 deazaflavin-dependent nitroreductase family protein [Mycolicibacterium neworleansense]